MLMPGLRCDDNHVGILVALTILRALVYEDFEARMVERAGRRARASSETGFVQPSSRNFHGVQRRLCRSGGVTVSRCSVDGARALIQHARGLPGRFDRTRALASR